MKLSDDNIIAFAEVASGPATAGDRNGVVLYRNGDEYVVHTFVRELPDGKMELFWGHYFKADLLGAVTRYIDKRETFRSQGIVAELRIDDTGA